jgi:hypothetical protein
MAKPKTKTTNPGASLAIPSPMLGLLFGTGEIRMDFEKDPNSDRNRLHDEVFGPIAASRARAKFRYDPEKRELMWTDRDDAKNEEIFYAVVNAVERRGGVIDNHSVLGEGRFRGTARMIASFNLKKHQSIPIVRTAVVSPETAKRLNYPTELPADQKFHDAVKNTEGASLIPEGLMLSVLRQQHPDQEGRNSLRGGIFYQPEGSHNKYPFTGKNGYGGSEKINGTTLLKRPMFVKGSVGGMAPTTAYDIIKGNGSCEKMKRSVWHVCRNMISWHDMGTTTEQDVYNVLKAYGGDERLAKTIFDFGSKNRNWNGMAMAMQENIIANTVRNAGYDSIIGWSRRRDGTIFMSEVFDLRETTYPGQFKPEGNIHSLFSPSGQPQEPQ